MRDRHATAALTLRLSLCVATTLALGACGHTGADRAAPGDAPPAATPSSAAPSTDGTLAPAPSTTAPTHPSGTRPPRLIAYAGGESPGVTVSSRADARNLIGAPAAFRAFVADTAERIHERSTCTDGAVGVTVETLRTDGYAVGGVNDCGGYAALWAVVDGHWQEIAGTQDSWDCDVLERHRVPSEVVGTSCYDDVGQQQHRYQQA